MPLIHAEHDPNLSCPPVVQVPVGLTADEARQILSRAVEPATVDANPPREVPPSGWGNVKPGSEIRVEADLGITATGPVRTVETDEGGDLTFIRLGYPEDKGIDHRRGYGLPASIIRRVFVLSEPTAPEDPDADLIELIAHGIVSAAVGEGQWERLQDSARLDWFIAARRALAVVRESEAGA